MNEILSSLRIVIRRCKREYDIANNQLQAEECSLDKYTLLLSRLSGCRARLLQFEMSIRQEVRINTRPERQHNLTSILENVKKIIQNLKQIIIRLKLAIEERECVDPFEVSLEYSNNPGRPKYIIHKEQILFLREYNFKWTTIASILGVSRSVLYRRRRTLGIQNDVTLLTDDQLDDLVRTAKVQNPQWGAVLIEGHLLSQGITVPRARILTSMSRVDPLFTYLRWRAPIERRRYHVPGPGSLWHIDGNHKLVRYGIYINAEIDGFSRVITFMKASSNNKSETVLQTFLKATDEHHLPSRIRTDYGTENVLIGEYMQEYRPEGHNAWLTGSSVHNQRIERLWRDLRHAVLNYWRDYFYNMEQTNFLNPQHKCDIIALHHIFLPAINKHITQFGNAWNNHKLRTEHQCSPWQLYIKGMLQRFGSTYTGIRDVLDDNVIDDSYGVDINYDDVEVEEDIAYQHPKYDVPRRLHIILQERTPSDTTDFLHTAKTLRSGCVGGKRFCP